MPLPETPHAFPAQTVQGIGLGVVLQLIAVYVIPDFFGIVPLAIEHWGYVITIAIAAFLVVEAIKWLEYKSTHTV